MVKQKHGPKIPDGGYPYCRAAPGPAPYGSTIEGSKAEKKVTDRDETEPIRLEIERAIQKESYFLSSSNFSKRKKTREIIVKTRNRRKK